MQQGLVDRPAQHACAVQIEAIMQKHPSSIGALNKLVDATSKEGNTDFARWLASVQPSERDLTKELAALFEHNSEIKPQVPWILAIVSL